MSENSRDYYEYRAGKARELAAATIDPKIAAIHSEMAERYDALASGASRRSTLQVVASGADRIKASA